MTRKRGTEPAGASGQHWVFHRAALGDSVLLWPMLRQWRRRGMDVVLVSDGEKGKLAAEELGIVAKDAEGFRALWVAGAAVEPVRGVAAVVAYLGRAGEATQVWMNNARRMFPGAAVRHRSARPSRAQALRFPLPALRENRRGPVVMHVGAGAEEKRWPLERWVHLAERIGTRAKLLAGEVERERFSEWERRAFHEAGGVFVDTLAALGGELRLARVVVCGDSGPGHLAAQLGVRVVSLFGPGNPERWAPVGPVVEVLAPDRPSPMDWLTVERAEGAVRGLMG